MSLKSLNARLAKIGEPDLQRYKADELYEKLKLWSYEEKLALRNVLRRDEDTDVKLTHAEFQAAINAELVALGLPPKPIDRLFATDIAKKNEPKSGKNNEQKKTDKPTTLQTPTQGNGGSKQPPSKPTVKPKP